MKRRKKTNLVDFLKENCANYSHTECHSFGGLCHVLEGKRCEYFENKVLGPPDYKYRLPGYDYARLYAEYARLTKSKKVQFKQRLCPGFEPGFKCGRPLLYRRQLCDDCRRKRMQKANRERQRKFRLQNVST